MNKDLLKDIPLVHGSKRGLFGKIAPVSRSTCDFGCGFYMSDKILSSKSICIHGKNPTFYYLTFQLSKINTQKVLVLTDELWFYTILAYRNLVPKFSNTTFCNQIKSTFDKYDLLIGYIADDLMFHAFKRFVFNSATDIGLMKVLMSVDLGYQYVVKSDYGTNFIKIEFEEKINCDEVRLIQIENKEPRAIMKEKVDKIISDNIDNGLKINEFVKKISSQNELLKTLLDKQKEKNFKLLNEIQDRLLCTQELLPPKSFFSISNINSKQNFLKSNFDMHL